MAYRSTILLLFLSIFCDQSLANVVKYQLTATRGKANLSGKKEVDFALMMNGSIPAPTLQFKEGDDAEITVVNKIPDEEVSVHWHGILLPNEMDGVPYVTTPPIFPGQSFVFKIKLRQNGTYWYHSHTNVQEQKGLYGAIIIHPKNETYKVNHDVVAVLSDWSDEDGLDILKNLHKDGDYYLYKKDTMRSWFGALQENALGTYLHNELTRMGGMDYSDVGYDAFLINGKKETQLVEAKPGEKVRVRLINASASSYFYISLANQNMNFISADGIDVEPLQAKDALFAMAETYDFIFTVPEQKNYELLVTAQDGTGTTSAWIGKGEKVPAERRKNPGLYESMDHSTMDHSQHQGMDHSKMDHSKMQRSVSTLDVEQLRAKTPMTKNSSAKTLDLKLVLDGDMERYVWHINGKAIHEERTITINENDVVRFTFENKTMMHHPMHLHGHFFRALNQFGDFSPLKHTVDVPPHGTRVIEFIADEPGQWMLHCHNLYHLKSGMARIVQYSSFAPKTEMSHHQNHDPHLHDHWYFYGSLLAATNKSELYLRESQTWNQWDLRVEANNPSDAVNKFSDKWEYEGEVFYRRWFGSYLNLIGGGIYFHKQARAAVGVSYLLPMLVESQILIDHKAKLRLNLEKKFQWSKHFLSEAELSWRTNETFDHTDDTDETSSVEYLATLMYAPSWSWAVGLTHANKKIGLGLKAQF